MDHYVFQTESEANACVSAINGTDWFPIDSVRGDANTTAWAKSPREMLSGEWAVPRIPESRLDDLSVPQEDRDNFIAAFGQDIRDIDGFSFPQPTEA